MVETRLVAGDGTGDYDCDGHADQTVINRALSWMAAEPGRQIHMRGPFTYGITDQLFIGSNSTWSGDSTAILRVEDWACGADYASCVFPNGTPVIAALNSSPSNIEVYGFQINGNCQNQHDDLGLVGDTYQSHGSGVERIFQFSNASNINLHNTRIYDAFGEALMIFGGHDIHASYNFLSNLQHDALYYKNTTGLNSMHHNTVEGITSDCLRVGSSINVDIYNNTLTSYLGPNNNGAGEHGQNGIQISNESNYALLTNNINVYNNYIYDQGLAGIWILDVRNTAGSTPQTVHIHDNTINQNGWSCWANWASGISIGPYGWGNGILIEDNTINGNYQQGIQVIAAISGSGFIVNTKNNNISNNIGKRAGSTGSTLPIVGYGIYNAMPGSTIKVVSQNDYVTNNLSGDFYGDIDHTTHEIIKIMVEMGMYASDPTLVGGGGGGGDDIKEGDYGLMIPTADNHYTFQKIIEPKVGQKALIYPAHASGSYYLLRVAETLVEGQKIITIPDKNGKFWPVLAK